MVRGLTKFMPSAVGGIIGAEWGKALHRARARLNKSEHASGAAVASDMAAAMCAISGKCAPEDAHVLQRTQGAKALSPAQTLLLRGPTELCTLQTCVPSF